MTDRDKIKILVVDDHAMVRSGLAAFLLSFEDLEMVGEASSAEEALRLCEEVRPEVILMDLVMPGMDGVDATRAIKERHPEIKVMALTSFPQDDLVHRALKAGATSYLLKDVSAIELAEAIRAAHAGRSILSPEATEALVRAAASPEPQYDLTEREREVLSLMVEGLSNPEIARRLVVAESTIKFHVSNILSKLAASSRTEAVALALQHDLVD